MREKLIEELTYLLECELAGDCSALAKEWADRLIASEVVVSKMETTTKWIPVTERLPGICDTVLVCYDFMGGKAVRISDRYGKNGMLWSGLPNGQKPTHWMPLPSTEGLG